MSTGGSILTWVIVIAALIRGVHLNYKTTKIYMKKLDPEEKEEIKKIDTEYMTLFIIVILVLLAIDHFGS